MNDDESVMTPGIRDTSFTWFYISIKMVIYFDPVRIRFGSLVYYESGTTDNSTHIQLKQITKLQSGIQDWLRLHYTEAQVQTPAGTSLTLFHYAISWHLNVSEVD